MSTPEIPRVMNGEQCPGCHTPIWGARPKRCFMCQYNFENPDPSQTLEARAEAELKAMMAGANTLDASFDDLKEVERSAKARIELMCTDYLEMEWPEHLYDGTTRNWNEGFLEAARIHWPEANFYDVETQAYRDNSRGVWHKRIKGKMDLPSQRVVGFEFDYRLKRDHEDDPL